MVDYWLWMAVAGMGFVAILFFNRQVKAIFNLVKNAVIGLLGILACNMLLAPVGVTIGVNLLTVSIAGILGIPGLLLLYLTQWMVG